MNQPKMDRCFFANDRTLLALDAEGLLWRRKWCPETERGVWIREHFEAAPEADGVCRADPVGSTGEGLLPSWEEAPDWANWRAVAGSNGKLFYFTDRPEFYPELEGDVIKFTDLHGTWAGAGVSGLTPLVGHNWREQRPRPLPQDDCELPAWDKAPDWAQYRAVNSRGLAWWFKNRPHYDAKGLFENLWEVEDIPGNFASIAWCTSIEARPFTPPWDQIDPRYNQYETYEANGYTFGRFYTDTEHAPFRYTADDIWTSFDRFQESDLYPWREWVRPEEDDAASD